MGWSLLLSPRGGGLQIRTLAWCGDGRTAAKREEGGAKGAREEQYKYNKRTDALGHWHASSAADGRKVTGPSLNRKDTAHEPARRTGKR